MNKIGKKHGLKIPQVAVAFCMAKGIVPICGCRKPYQVDDLFAAANTKLTDEEVKLLENEADKLNVKILGADMFRFAVKKS
ncbi:MAG: aldo/keto reductase [Butyrivibrio hungatei]|nr:aldo/keto reductase [Butyrivibrio hungatei]